MRNSVIMRHYRRDEQRAGALQWTGAIEIKNIIEVMTDFAGLGEIERNRKYDLSGLKVVPYYVVCLRA